MPKEVYSTLAHEFQHMIHFYQKAFVAGAGNTADAWINEMCSVLAEDLLADKIGVPGPRGVDYSIGSSGSSNNAVGRIPIYNRYTYLPLASADSVWNGSDARYYSTVYAFGSWAARNYEGANFLHNVVCSPYTDAEAVEKAAALGGAAQSDINSLIARWAVSVMGSNRTDMPNGYRCNRGDWFTSSINNATYNLGSIDFFKYVNGVSGTGPYFVTNFGAVSGVYASSNVYFLAAQGLSGKKTFSISLPVGVQMSVVVK